MFSNGTEYESFLDSQCGECPHFVHFEDATEDRPVCEVEEKIALCSIAEHYKPPLEWLDGNGFMHRYDCRKKAGLPPREMGT
ncbi:hypothetical protein AB4Z21_00910 [Paenibacillus sp. MCAF20]